MCEKKHNVLIVHNYYQIPGGEDTVVANEKKMLEEHGHKVLLYTRHNSELKSLSKWQKMTLPITTIFNFKTYAEVKKLIKDEKIEVVHVHNTLNLISPSVYYAAFSCNVPVVQTVHNFRLVCPGATFFRNGNICEECLKKGLLCAVKNKCYRDSRLQSLACVISTRIHRVLGAYGKLNYICLTQFNKEKLLNLKQITEETVYVKPNFVKADPTVKINQDRKNQMIYAGRLDKIKGVDFLLEAWKEMRDSKTQLLVYGTGPLEGWCKAYIESHQLKNVEMMGLVDNKEIKNILCESKGLILPTRWYEGFPMTILEAFSVGTPVLGSAIGNVGNLIKEHVNGSCFSVDNKEELLNAVKNLDVNYQKVFDYFQENYSAESNYDKLKMIYEGVTNRKSN